MSKKQQAVLEKERRAFLYGDEAEGVPGAIARGMDEAVAGDLVGPMMAFANYAFNKSHACAYAMVAYQTAYLKRYYPVEFMTALLNSFISSKLKLAEYIGYLKKSGVAMLPPDINRSQMRFSTENGAIRFGLSAITYVGGAIEDVIARRGAGYTGFDDFVGKNADVLNKKRLESLILSGCFDCFGLRRAQLYAAYEQILAEAQQAGKRQADGQVSLFDSAREEFALLKAELPDVPEFTKDRLLAYEKEMTGLYISGHPLDDIAHVLKSRPLSIADIVRTAEDEAGMFEFDGRAVELLGIANDVRLRQTKAKKNMANFTLEDLYAQINVIVFPNTLERCEDVLKQDAIVNVGGKITVTASNGMELLAEKVERYIPDDAFFSGKQFYVKVTPDRDVDGLLKITARHRGDSGIVVYVEQTGQKYKLCGGRSVRYSAELLDELKAFLGEGNVVVK
jgi:DNA polymerase-3 subunit alpha